MKKQQKGDAILIISLIAIGILSIIVANLFKVYQIERPHHFLNSFIYLGSYFFIPLTMFGISIAIIVTRIKQSKNKNDKKNTRINNMCN